MRTEEYAPHPGTGSYQTDHSPTHSTRSFETEPHNKATCTERERKEPSDADTIDMLHTFSVSW